MKMNRRMLFGIISIALAAEHLLDLYSVVGFLFFSGEEAFEEWSYGIWWWIVGP